MASSQMAGEDLLNHLRGLEVLLHQPTVRSDVDRLEDLLHESFAEIGRSGLQYSRADILRELPLEQRSGSIWSQDFVADEVADGVTLLSY